MTVDGADRQDRSTARSPRSSRIAGRHRAVRADPVRPDGYRRGTARRAARALLVAGRAAVPSARQRLSPAGTAVRRLRRREDLRPRPAHARPARPEGPGAGPGAAQRRGVRAVPAVQPRLRVPVEPARRRPGRARRQRHPLGRRHRPADSTTGSPPATARPRSSATTPTRPGTRRCCRSGQPASGSPSCATAARRNCCPSPASTRGAGLPLSVIVADFFHWTHLGDWRFDPAEWPDPAAHGAGAGRSRRQADGLGVAVGEPAERELPRTARTAACWSAPSRACRSTRPGRTRASRSRCRSPSTTPTNPAAREFVWSTVKRNYFDLGVRAWWLDACEPEIQPGHPATSRFHAGPGAEVVNIYPTRPRPRVHEAPGGRR